MDKYIYFSKEDLQSMIDYMDTQDTINGIRINTRLNVATYVERSGSDGGLKSLSLISINEIYNLPVIGIVK